MNTLELAAICNLEFQYYAILAANPDWDVTLWEYLIARGIAPDDIWEYSAQIGYEHNQPEPEWL